MRRARARLTPPDRSDDLPWDPDRVDDDVLALMFVACHPVLAPEARVALTLRVVGGLASEEIARAFLVPVPTVQARITRAKKTIAAAGVPFELPPAEERRERLGGVLSVLYVIFTEGSTATTGDRLLRPDLAYEAIRLARMLAALLPDEPEVYGLLALFELTAARFPARTGPDGEAVLLEDQDRRRWDRSAIRRGLAAIGRASAAGRGLGPYGLQAAIAACHASASSVPETDWERIVLLYEALGPGGALTRGRAQPGRRRRDGERTTGGTGHCGRTGGHRPPVGVVPAPERARRTARPARPHQRGPGRAGTRRPTVRQRPRAVGAAAQGGRVDVMPEGRYPRTLGRSIIHSQVPAGCRRATSAVAPPPTRRAAWPNIRALHRTRPTRGTGRTDTPRQVGG